MQILFEDGGGVLTLTLSIYVIAYMRQISTRTMVVAGNLPRRALPSLDVIIVIERLQRAVLVQLCNAVD
jgi:hypothetical protein